MIVGSASWMRTRSTCDVMNPSPVAFVYGIGRYIRRHWKYWLAIDFLSLIILL